MKKLVWILVGLTLVGLAVPASMAKPAKNVLAKRVSAKAARAADENAIKQVMLKEMKRHGEADNVVFDPIKLADGWAKTTFSVIDKGKKLPFEADFLLHKEGGQWSIVSEYYNGMIAPVQARKFGLKPATAKKLGIELRVSTS